MRTASLPALGALLLSACTSMNEPPLTATSRWFGEASDGRPARLWTLRVPGLEIDVTDYGATLVAVRTPDRAGFLGDIVLGFDDVRGYQSADNQYFGCTTGRVCNRIARGEFVLDGHRYVLATNNGPNHLHGGARRSLDKVFWRAEPTGTPDRPAVRFTYRSPDGEEGYPGNLDVAVTYSLAPGPAPQLSIAIEARTDRATPVNITNHAYWNLDGAGAPTVLDHELQLAADRWTPTDDTLIPTGAIADVLGTPLDFTKPLPIGLRIDQLSDGPAKGYDHNYVLRGDADVKARLYSPASGRWLEIRTSEPALQVYSGNWLFGQRGKGGRTYAPRSAVCLETQHHPDSVNHPHFPSTILAPGQVYRTETTWTFGVD